MTEQTTEGTTVADLRRELLRSNDKVRVKHNGEVHCYGVMPNTNRVGWYLAGFATDLCDFLDRERARLGE